MKRQKCKIINLGISIFCFTCLIFPASALEIEKSQPDTATDERIKGFLRENHWEQAWLLLQSKLEANPSDFATREKLVNFALLMGKRYEAELLLAQAQTLYPESLEPLLLEAQILAAPIVMRGERVPEEKALDRLVEISEEAAYLSDAHPGTLYLKGLSAKLQGDTHSAETFFLRALYQDPQYLKAQRELVELYLQQHQVKPAIPLITQALDQGQGGVDSYYLVGLAFMEKGNPEKALVYFSQSQQSDPQERPLRLIKMADAYLQLGQTKEAMASYQKVLVFWPQRDDLWVRFAKLAESFNLDSEALAAYQKAHRLNPTILKPFLTQAETTFWTKSLFEALPMYQNILQIAPERVDVLSMMVSIQYRLWQEGSAPLPSTLDALEKQLHAQVQDESTESRQLAELKLQAVRENGWGPGLITVLDQVIGQAHSPFIQLEGTILLHQPVKAKPLLNHLASLDNLRMESQQLALLGVAAPTARLVEEASNAESPMLLTWLQAWAKKDEEMAQTALSQAGILVKANQLAPARSALEKALAFAPLSSAVSMAFAQYYLAKDELDAAQRYLTEANELGLSESLKTKFQEAEKQLSDKIKRQEKAKARK